jgi:hypothetical protein
MIRPQRTWNMEQVEIAMPRVFAVILGAFLGMFSIHAQAHHSTTAFDMSRTVVLKGSFRQFNYQNPHINLVLDVEEGGGKVTTYQIEGPPPAWFRQAGIRRADFDKGVGQAVTLEVHPSKDGSMIGFFQKITFTDGTYLRFVSQ